MSLVQRCQAAVTEVDGCVPLGSKFYFQDSSLILVFGSPSPFLLLISSGFSKPMDQPGGMALGVKNKLSLQNLWEQTLNSALRTMLSGNTGCLTHRCLRIGSHSSSAEKVRVLGTQTFWGPGSSLNLILAKSAPAWKSPFVLPLGPPRKSSVDLAPNRATHK